MINNEKYQIFCDMDGVLVDLMGGINKAIYGKAPEGCSHRYVEDQNKAREVLGGKPATDKDTFKDSSRYKKEVRKFMYRVMGDDRKFWMNLEWKPGGKELWEYIKKYNPVVLSRPTDLQCVIGKKKWVKDHLGLKGDQVQIRFNKTPFAQYKGKIGILIDDFKTNTIPFAQAGGEVVLYKEAVQAIKEIKVMEENQGSDPSFLVEVKEDEESHHWYNDST